MAQGVSASEIRRRLQAAQRQAERELKRQVDQANRANKKAVDNHNRQVQAEALRIDQHNRRVIDNHNRQVGVVNRYNEEVVGNLNQQLAAASQPRTVTYTVQERQLVDRVQDVTRHQDEREFDIFLSYARIDGAAVAQELRDALAELGVSVWQDDISMRLGRSMSRQIDHGLLRAQAGVAVLTPAYLAGRFWTERELGALLHKDTLIPVLHNVTFADVKKYSGILPDLLGLTTEQNSVAAIAEKIATAVLAPEAA